MPDHPSWPAELVEKAARAIGDCEVMSSHRAMARHVLSALSGDLVPREEVVRRLNDALGGDGGLDDDDLEGMVDVVRAIETARKYEAERYDTARSQADALAGALERAQWGTEDMCPVCWDPDGATDRPGEPIYGIEPDHHPDCKIGRALASYHREGAA